jgi:zinc metalloprotease ZmpA
MTIRQVVFGLAIFAAVIGPAIDVQAQSRGDQAVAAALEHFRVNAQNYGIGDRDLSVRRISDQGNQVVVRFDQFFRGVKVFEGEAIARVSNGRVDVTNALRGGLNIDIQPGISLDQAVATAQRAIGNRGPAQASGQLQILPQGQRSGRDVLVWHVVVEYDNDLDEPGSWDYFVDAKSGAVVWSFDSLHTVSVVGKTMYSGDVTLDATLSGSTYSLVNPGQGASPGNSTNNMANRRFGKGQAFTSSIASFGNNQLNNSDVNTAGADAHFGLANTWSFYQTMFGRNGIDGTGRRTYQRVHYSRNYENANWSDSCFCMTYGDGASSLYPLVSLDIAGHEMSHGVTSSEANLTYSGESGGLNESTSDIFGTMVEFFANNAVDTPDFWVGEKVFRANYPGGVYTQNTALRFMDDPNKDGRSPACWSSTIGGLNVHYSSGPNNHMFYLLSQGGTSKCNGNVVAGIGNDKASRIWYKALTDFMTASTSYHGARTAALNAASALYGNGSPEYNATAAAFSAINVN